MSTASGTLYVVATPIGNLSDITLRAIDTLRGVDRVVAEDTRRTRGLLSHLQITGKPLDSLDAHASAEQIERVVASLLGGQSTAMVTDAGVPSVSDPGTSLVNAALEAGVRVIPIPGPSAVTAAVAASGLVANGFRFVGFLPRSGSARGQALALVTETPEPVILFESPNRVSATLAELAALTPERAVAVLREITKLHEELVRGTLAELAALTREWLGEITIVLGAHERAAAEAAIDDDELDARIDDELRKGAHAKTVADRVAAWSGRPRRDVYTRVIERKR